jgi:hypothetical protein
MMLLDDPDTTVTMAAHSASEKLIIELIKYHSHDGGTFGE